MRRRIVFEGDILTGRFRDDYPLSPEQPASLMMRCGSAPNYITLTAIANHSNVGISSVPWVPARFGDFGRLANRNWTWEQPPALVKFAQSVQLVGKEDFEGFQIQVIEVRPWAGKNKKAWIDPARGYICPRLEVYDGETLANLRDILELDGHQVNGACTLKEATERRSWSESRCVIHAS